jgi:hypothetical protein
MIELMVAFRNSFEKGRKNVRFIFPSFFVCTFVVFKFSNHGASCDKNWLSVAFQRPFTFNFYKYKQNGGFAIITGRNVSNPKLFILRDAAETDAEKHPAASESLANVSRLALIVCKLHPTQKYSVLLFCLQPPLIESKE